MASPFAFVPRSIKQKSCASKPDRAVSTNAPSTPEVVGAQVPGGSHGPRNEESTAGKSAQVNAPLPEYLAALVCLALSDYALWSNSDLRRRIALGDRRGEPEAEDTNDDGYVALSYLLAHSDVFKTNSASNTQPLNMLPQTTFAKAVRMHASNFLDVRLVLSPTQASHDVGYEVRRRDWSARPFDAYGKSDWERLTVYVENIPVQYRTLGAVLSFIKRLLPESTQSIQHIFFPRHHRDPPRAVAVCKGFALVTLSLDEDVDLLLSRWPWKLVSSSLDADKECSDIAIDAQRNGFRTIRKKAWEDLRAEYLLYRQRLIDEINTIQDAQEKPPLPTATTSIAKRKYTSEDSNQEVPQDTRPNLPQLHPNSPYPPGCLVFARNLHPETNKTTLKHLFSKFGPGLDYVDYTKGIDSAHLRLKNPETAQLFVDHFASHAIAQTSGLDDKGAELGENGKAIEAVLLRGRPEDIYWGKVPEKIRAQAVKQALQASSAAKQVVPSEAMGQGKKKRKRIK